MGNVLLVLEISMQVLPTVLSLTVTHLMKWEVLMAASELALLLHHSPTHNTHTTTTIA